MRRLLLPVACLCLTAAGQAVAFLALTDGVRPAVEAPGVPAASINNPDLHVRLIAQFVATRSEHGLLAEADLPYTRFFSFYDTAPGHLEEDVLFLNWYVQQMSFSQAVNPLKEVPGSRGRLYYVDIRRYLWNPGAFRAVAERDQTFAEPWLDPEHMDYLRAALVAPPSEEALKGREVDAILQKIIPAGFVIYAPQFVRDVLETDRTPSYYDLLYARYRFVGPGFRQKVRVPVKVTKTVVHQGGAYTYPDGRVVPNVPPGKYQVETTEFRVDEAGAAGYKFRDFPKDEEDFEAAFGIDKVKAFGLEQEIDLDFGAVVAGGADFPGQGSIVARQNRLLVFLMGPLGPFMETYDVKKTSGVRNFSEVLIFGSHYAHQYPEKFRRGVGVKAVRDGGEILAMLPNGGQAGLLINAQAKRVERADTALAVDTADPHMNPGVRNYGSCPTCHAQGGGFVVPNDLVGANLERGLKRFEYDPDRADRLKGFFFGWQDRMTGFWKQYHALLARCTQTRPDDPGWNGARLARYILDVRHRYDAPLDAEASAAHVGVPLELYKRLANSLTFGGPKEQLQGQKVARTAWDEDYYPVVQTLRQAEVDATARRTPYTRPPGTDWPLERYYLDAYRRRGE